MVAIDIRRIFPTRLLSASMTQNVGLVCDSESELENIQHHTPLLYIRSRMRFHFRGSLSKNYFELFMKICFGPKIFDLVPSNLELGLHMVQTGKKRLVKNSKGVIRK